MNKPKKQQPRTPTEPQGRDLFQTPNYATDILIPFLPKVPIWEPACGDGKIVYRLRNRGFDVRGTDVRGFDSVNFLTDTPRFSYNAIVTNPPFSLKKEFIYRAIQIGVPFTFLIPSDFCGWILQLMRHGAQWVIPTRRINFITPTGRSGNNSASTFHSGWFTLGLDLPHQISIVDLDKDAMINI